MYQTYMLYYFLQVREKEGDGVMEDGRRATVSVQLSQFPCCNSYLAAHESLI